MNMTSMCDKKLFLHPFDKVHGFRVFRNCQDSSSDMLSMCTLPYALVSCTAVSFDAFVIPLPREVTRILPLAIFYILPSCNSLVIGESSILNFNHSFTIERCLNALHYIHGIHLLFILVMNDLQNIGVEMFILLMCRTLLSKI